MPELTMSQVAEQLLSQTKEHKVNWEETSRKGSYRVHFPDIALTITRVSPNLDEVSDMRLELMSDGGRVIDSLDAAHENPMHSTLNQIFEIAQQDIQDSGIDKALNYLKQ